MGTTIVQDSCGKVFWLIKEGGRTFFRDPETWAYDRITHCPKCKELLSPSNVKPWPAPEPPKSRHPKCEWVVPPPPTHKVHLPGSEQDSPGDIHL